MTGRVLVTGAGGFVGSHVVEVLLARTDRHVIGVDSFRHNGATDKLVTAIGENPRRVTALTHDLTVPLSSGQLDVVRDVDCVINVASRCHVDESIAEPIDFVLNNVALGLRVAELTRQLNARLIHVSTDEVYGPNGDADRNVETDHRPSSPYAASKAAQEDVVHAYARTYGVRATIVNSANMFGERQGGFAFVPMIIDAVMRDTTIDVHHVNGVPGRRNYTYVRNVAEVIVDHVLNDDDNDNTRRVHLPGQRAIDNLELAQRVATLVGAPLRWRAVEATSVRPGYDPNYGELTGSWSPRVSFDRGLAATVADALVWR